jgi:hypothetical protein
MPRGVSGGSVDRTVQPVPPAKVEAAAVATRAAVLRMVTGLVTGFG